MTSIVTWPSDALVFRLAVTFRADLNALIVGLVKEQLSLLVLVRAKAAIP